MNLLFILSVVGLSLIIVESQVLNPIREYIKRWNGLYSLTICYQCVSFWVGMFLGYFLVSKEWIEVFACGCTGSFLTVLAVSTLNTLEYFSIPKMNCSKCQKSPDMTIPVSVELPK